MADARRSGVDWSPSPGQIAGGLLKGHEEAINKAGKAMLRGVPRTTRYIAKHIPGQPGLLLDVASFATAKDKRRAGLEIAGGAAGAALGGLVGGPLGAALGSTAGSKGVELLYDHRDDIAAWMKDRQAQVNRAAYGLEHAFDNGLPPYAPSLR